MNGAVTGFTTSAPSIYERDGRKRHSGRRKTSRMCSIPFPRSTTRRSPMCAARSARHRRLCTPTFALVADDPSVQIVSQAQTWYIDQMMKGTEWEGLPILSAAAPVQGRRPWRSGLLHRCRTRRCRHQERFRPVSLSEHRAGRGHHRCAGQGLVGNAPPESSTRSNRARQDQALINNEFPVLQFRCY